MYLWPLCIFGSLPFAGATPNIVFIMADDLNADWKSDRLSYMPNLRRYFKAGGAEFVNHVAVIPVCGPSRSSLLTGRYPHNTGYLMNDDLDSIDAFCAGPKAASNANNTVGRWLRDAGYHTSFLGKYVNSCEQHVPSGWSHWGGFIQTYDFYNASMYDMEWGDDGSEPARRTRVMTGIHQADFLGNLTLEQARVALKKGKPFFIHVTPVMPHWGTCYGPHAALAPDDPHWEFKLTDPTTGRTYAMPTSPCPTDRHKHSFDGHTNPRISSVWNKSITGPRPKHMTKAYESKGIDSFQAAREDIGFRNRSASLLDLDDMIGDIMHGLEQLRVLDNTYVFFSSDNGYHLGEHMMPFGKGQPYETDVRLPMYVAGPNVHHNSTMEHPTTHLDIVATIVELANAKSIAPKNLDGKSFATELSGGSGTADSWRQFSYSEFFSGDNTWRLIRVTNSTSQFTYARWCTDNDTEVFELQSDPWQTVNLVGQQGWPQHVIKTVGPWASALSTCSGISCSVPEVIKPVLNNSFSCYSSIQGKNARQGSFNFQVDEHSQKLKAIRGWAVDFSKDGPGTPHPRGFTSLEVRLRMDGKWLSHGFQQIANISRPDLRHVGSLARLPNDEHGFLFDCSKLPTSASVGKHEFDVVQVVRDAVTGVITQLPPLSKNPPKKCLCDGLPCALSECDQMDSRLALVI